MGKQFSAEQIVTGDKGGSDCFLVYVDHGKVRVEAKTENGTSLNIIRPDLQKWYLVMVNRKSIMELPYSAAKTLERLTEGDAFLGKNQLLDAEVTDGVNCMHYKVTNVDGTISFTWIDPARRAPVKMVRGDVTTEWKNYQEGPQDASLFEIPKDYKMVTFRAPGSTGN